ncbi:glycosyl hydrolase 53 family protein [Actinocorallia libanotica]|uniref:Arabinogalactan endo-beta-1,4-galactanase n=1 Tax=Actinocorallia libanotica TaxID=46162 RepID=A0ABP4BXN5_9ACTN
MNPTPRNTGPRLGRRTFLTASAATGLALGLSTAPALAAGPASRGFRTALSVSPFTELVLGSVALTDGERTARTVEQVQRLFKAHGSTEVYARIATLRDAPSGEAQHGLARGLQRARLARTLDQPFNPEIGLFAVYGDISHQPEPDFSDYPGINPPAPWTSLTVDQMIPFLYRYGVAVALQILATGARVNVWNLGNEIELGLAGVAVRGLVTQTDRWTYSPPDAIDPAIGQMDFTTLIMMPEPDRIAWLEAHLWPHIGRMLAATAAGIRSVHPTARFSSHTSTIGSASTALPVAFWKAMRKAGYQVSEMGTSFYPTSNDYGDRMAAFKDAAATLHTTFGKRVFVAELGYPSSTMPPPYAWNSPLPGYPISPEGEHAFVRDLVAWGAGSGPLSGVRPWAPDFCISGWQPMSHFTASGSTATAQPVLDAISEGLAAAT